MFSQKVSFMTREERNAYMREWNRANRERINAERRAKHAADPEKKREYMRLWKDKNKEAVAQHNRTYYGKNSERIKTRVADWYEKNREYGLEYRKEYYQATREMQLAQQKERRIADPEATKLKKKLEYDKHADRYKASGKRWREANRERCKANRNAWKEANWGKVLAQCAAQRAAKLERIPLWADLDDIDRIYDQCPDGYHVDHIYPMRGKTVSGLHVSNNLRFSTAVENLSKRNRMPTPEEVSRWDAEMAAFVNQVAEAA